MHEFRVIGHDWPMEITSVTMEMAQIRPVSGQFSTQECGNCERQFLKKSGQLAKMIYAIHINYECMTYVYHMCIMILYDTYIHISHIDTLTVPFLD